MTGGYVRFTSPLGIMSWPEFEWDLKFVLHCPWCNVMAEFVLGRSLRIAFDCNALAGMSLSSFHIALGCNAMAGI